MVRISPCARLGLFVTFPPPHPAVPEQLLPRGCGASARHQPLARPLPPLGPGDASSKPSLLLPAEDGEDLGTRTHGLLEKGAVSGHVGGGEFGQPRWREHHHGEGLGVGKGCTQLGWARGWKLRAEEEKQCRRGERNPKGATPNVQAKY